MCDRHALIVTWNRCWQNSSQFYWYKSENVKWNFVNLRAQTTFLRLIYFDFLANIWLFAVIFIKVSSRKCVWHRHIYYVRCSKPVLSVEKKLKPTKQSQLRMNWRVKRENDSRKITNKLKQLTWRAFEKAMLLFVVRNCLEYLWKDSQCQTSSKTNNYETMKRIEQIIIIIVHMTKHWEWAIIYVWDFECEMYE